MIFTVIGDKVIELIGSLAAIVALHLTKWGNSRFTKNGITNEVTLHILQNGALQIKQNWVTVTSRL